MHLEVDMSNPYGIKNLPEEWVAKINASKISAADIKSDPKGMIDMISNFDDDIKQSKIEMQLISSSDFLKIAKDIEFIEENPATYFVFDK